MRKFVLLLVLLTGCSTYHVGDTVRTKVAGAPVATVIRVKPWDLFYCQYTIIYTDGNGHIMTVEDLPAQILEPVAEKP